MFADEGLCCTNNNCGKAEQMKKQISVATGRKRLKNKSMYH
jgi:hypothetical protein